MHIVGGRETEKLRFRVYIREQDTCVHVSLHCLSQHIATLIRIGEEIYFGGDKG